MKDSERETFGADLGVYAVGFGVSATPVLKEFYWRTLRDLPFDAIKRGMALAARESRFMPRPADIRALAAGPRLEDRAAMAWLSVSTAVRQHGLWTGVDFEDPTVNAAIRAMGGWKELCSSEEDWFNRWAPKQFKEAFMAANRCGCSEQAMAPLGGLGDKVATVSVEGYNPRTALNGRSRAELKPASMEPTRDG